MKAEVVGHSRPLHRLIDTPRLGGYHKQGQTRAARRGTSDSSFRERHRMILGKFWGALRAQINKVANFFWTADPIAQMQYEYDTAWPNCKKAAKVSNNIGRWLNVSAFKCQCKEAHSESRSQVKAYLQAGDRESAAKFALELQTAKNDLAENESQLKMHEEAYKQQSREDQACQRQTGQGPRKDPKVRCRTKMSKAEAEIANLARDFNFDVSTDFGQIEQVIQDKIGLNRAKVRVAADLSQEGMVDVKREQAAEKVMADQALRQFEVEMGLVTPETTSVPEDQKELGPRTQKQS